jgi:hypothetical protein
VLVVRRLLIVRMAVKQSVKRTVRLSLVIVIPSPVRESSDSRLERSDEGDRQDRRRPPIGPHATDCVRPGGSSSNVFEPSPVMANPSQALLDPQGGHGIEAQGAPRRQVDDACFYLERSI